MSRNSIIARDWTELEPDISKAVCFRGDVTEMF